MKITKGTIVRTIMTVLVIINMILKQTGHTVLEIDEDSVASFVEIAVEAAVIIVAWWKNNSFSENAKRADAFLKQLNENAVNEDGVEK